MHEDTDLATDGPGRSAEVDQVAAARDWLLRHGVDLGDEQTSGTTSPGDGVERSGAGESGYSRSRRAGFSGSTGRSVSRRRPRGRESDAAGGADEADEADAVTGTSVRAGAATDPDADPEEVARAIVLRKLAVQARTRVELERALQGRDVPEEAAAAVLDRMTELGLVDDVTFAHDWVASRQQRRHLSRTALRRELQTRGVDRDVIDEALTDVEGADEHRAALDLAQRRVGPLRGLTREVAYRRLGGMLARRGFSASTTNRVLGEVLGDWSQD